MLITGAEMMSGGNSRYEQQDQSPQGRTGAPEDKMGDFVAAVLGNTEDTWAAIFKAGNSYNFV